MMRVALLSAIAVAIGATACVPEGQLKTRAAFDFNCPANQLKLTELSAQSRGVEGCGKRATYVYLPNGEWVMDNASDSQNSAKQ